MQELRLHISNVTCNGCIKNIKDGLSDKTSDVQIDLETKIAQIQYDETQTSEDELKRYIDLLGYTAQNA